MLAEPRRQSILELIASRGYVTLTELIHALRVSESTVRRDLESLEQSGLVKRTHGGAVCSADFRAMPMPALEDRAGTRAEEKRAIGRAAADLVEDGDSVILDGGTTTLEVARALVGRPIQIVTNSLPIAQLAQSAKETDLILIGGYVYPRTGVALGPLAVAMMRDLRVRKAILGAGGVMPEGVYNSNPLLVETERAMMACAQEVVLVADQSKFNRQALAWLCDLDRLDVVVTDPGVPPELRDALDAAGVRLRIASASAPETETPAKPSELAAPRVAGPRARPPKPKRPARRGPPE